MTRVGTSEATTHGIEIRVSSSYLRALSRPDLPKFVFKYHVVITNRSPEDVRLLSRRWVVTDGNGTECRSIGPGVAGVQPKISVGETFDFTSRCSLETPVGSMHGSYQFQTGDGAEFDAQVQVFTLAVPYAIN